MIEIHLPDIKKETGYILIGEDLIDIQIDKITSEYKSFYGQSAKVSFTIDYRYNKFFESQSNFVIIKTSENLKMMISSKRSLIKKISPNLSSIELCGDFISYIEIDPNIIKAKIRNDKLNSLGI